MAGTFAPLHPTTRKYVDRAHQERYPQDLGSWLRDCMRRSPSEIVANEKRLRAVRRERCAPARKTSAV
jgi:hypothetical protein